MRVKNLLPVTRYDTTRDRCFALGSSLRTKIKIYSKYLLPVAVLALIAYLLAEPLCNLPVIPSHVPYCAPYLYIPRFSLDFPKLAGLQTRLESVMEESTSSAIEATDMKRSELSIRDLIQFVEESGMLDRTSLMVNLNDFAQDAKTAGRDLREFAIRVTGTVDETVTTSEYVLLMLQQAAKMQPQTSGDSVQRGSDPPPPIASVPPRILATKMKEIETAWYNLTGAIKSAAEQLIHEARSNKDTLGRLEAKLEPIPGIVLERNAQIIQNENRVRAKLWMNIIKNKAKLKNYGWQRHLLVQAQNYREEALKHITSALLRLEKARADLEQIEKVSTSALLTQGAASGFPIEVQIAALQQGTERLLEGRKRVREREAKYLQGAD